MDLLQQRSSRVDNYDDHGDGDEKYAVVDDDKDDCDDHGVGDDDVDMAIMVLEKYVVIFSQKLMKFFLGLEITFPPLTFRESPKIKSLPHMILFKRSDVKQNY